MKNPTQGSQTFSVSWAVGIFVCHIAVTIALSLLIFTSGMQNFTTGTGWFHELLTGLLCIVSPPLMMAGSGSGAGGASIAIFTFFWHLFVACMAGFIRALSRRPAVYPDAGHGESANPDLAGTPWAKDPHHVHGADPAKRSKG